MDHGCYSAYDSVHSKHRRHRLSLVYINVLLRHKVWEEKEHGQITFQSLRI